MLDDIFLSTFSFFKIKSRFFCLFVIFVKIKQVWYDVRLVRLYLFFRLCILLYRIKWQLIMDFLFKPYQSFCIKIIFWVNLSPRSKLIFQSQWIWNNMNLMIFIFLFMSNRIILQSQQTFIEKIARCLHLFLSLTNLLSSILYYTHFKPFYIFLFFNFFNWLIGNLIRNEK